MHDLPELVGKTARIVQYADDYLKFCSDKNSESALEVLQDNFYNLEDFFV